MKNYYFFKSNFFYTLVLLFIFSSINGVKAQDVILFDGSSLNNEFSQFNSITLDDTEWSPNSSVEASVKIDNGSWDSGDFWDDTESLTFENVDLVNGTFTIDYKTTEVTHIKGFSLQDWSNGCSKVATLLDDGSKDYTGLNADGEWHTLTIEFNDDWSQDYYDCYSPSDQVSPRIKIQVGTAGVIWFDHAVYNAPAETYTLTVENGTGGGDYEEGQDVDISANVSENETFVNWTGDVDNVNDVNAAETTITMPADNITITANVASTIADLSDLSVDVGTLSPDFDAATTEYTVTVPSGTSETPTVTPTLADENASYAIDDATDIQSETEADRTTTITVTAEDEETEKVYTVVFDGVVGMKEFAAGEFNVYPNPVNDEIKLINNNRFDRISIYSITGQQVMNFTNISSGKVSLNVSKLQSGAYIVKFYNANEELGNTKMLKK